MDLHHKLAENVAAIQTRIERACLRAQRDPQEVTLIAVSKTVPAAAVRAAYEIGLRNFGESYGQELRDKAADLADLTDLRWHFIGPLQKNKIKYVVGRCTLIHSVDSLELMDEIEKDTAFYIKSGGGITASGGEAAMQTEFLVEFFKKCKERSIHTALDLCGAIMWSKYEVLIPYTDLYLYDIKEIDPKKHKEFTGMSNDLILKNLEMLLEQVPKIHPNAEFWIRTPLIPKFTATEENIHGIGSYIRTTLKNKVQRWDLLAFNNLAGDKYKRMDLEYKCADLGLFTKDEMDRFLEIAKEEINKDPSGKGMIITTSGLMKQNENNNINKINGKDQMKPSTGCG